MSLSRLLLLIFGLSALLACSKSPQQGGMHMPPAEVSVFSVTAADIPVTYEYVGQTVGSREVEVRARVAGNIDKRLYEEGAYVKEGQPLFQLDQRPFVIAVAQAEAAVSTAEAQIASAEASAAQAKREKERLSPLAEAKAISRKESDDANSSEQIASANLLQAKAQLLQAKAQLQEARLNLNYANIKAPSSGVTGRALKQEGALVTSSDSLVTTLTQLDPLYVSFSVGDGERQRMEQEIADGKLEVTKDGLKVRLLQRDGTPLGNGGKINFTSPNVSNQTGTVEMRATLPNPNLKLKSGIFVKVVMEGLERKNAIAIPQRAVLEGPNSKIVMVVDKDKEGNPIANPRPIEVAEWTVSANGEKNWVVRSGLNVGDQVITEGLMKLRPGAPINLSQADTASKKN